MTLRKRRAFLSRRLLLIGGIEAASFCVLVRRLYEIQIVNPRRYTALGQHDALETQLIEPERGLIVDRNGHLLAYDRPQWRVIVSFDAMRDPARIVARLASLIRLSPQQRIRLHSIARNKRSSAPVVFRRDLDWNELARLEFHRPSLPGISVERSFLRLYPLGPDAAHTVGYVIRPDTADSQNHPALRMPGARIGGMGIEKAANGVLFGVPGLTEEIVDAQGSVVRVERKILPRNGQTVRLTVDADLQKRGATILANRPGAAVLLDASSGEVLAMVSAPTFDPTLFDTGVPEAVWRQWSRKRAHHPLTDRSVQGLYAPGSVFKPTAALAALTCEAITQTTRFFCPGYMKIGDRIFYCWLRTGHGWMNVVSALQQSCDVFFYHVALRTGIDRMAAMGRSLGLTGQDGLGLLGVARGILPTQSWAKRRGVIWTEGNTAMQGIGQGYTALTPLALAIMTARIATGRAVRARLIKGVGNLEAPVKGAAALGLKESYLSVIRKGLFDVVNTPLGTAWGARLILPEIRMAGKTGTAQVFGENARMEAMDYNDANLPWAERPNALFVGYAPAQSPRFVAAIVIEHGTLLGPVKVARDLLASALSPSLWHGSSGIATAAGTANRDVPNATG